MNDSDGSGHAALQSTSNGMNPYQRQILLGMNRLNKHVYEGTVTSKVKKARRASNKIAKASRKMNRPA